MSEQEQGYYEQEKPGNERSLYADMIRSRDFAEQETWSNSQLRELGDYWKDQEKNPERSVRAIGEIGLLLNRVAFELTMRQEDILQASKRIMEEELCWELLDK